MPRRSAIWRWLAAALGAVVLAPSAPPAQTQKSEIGQLGAAAQIAALRRLSVQLAGRIRVQEATLNRLENRIRRAKEREKALAAGYSARQTQLARILAILQRVQVHPPALLAMNRQDANNAIRAAIVVRRLVPHLQRKVQTLRRQQQSLAKLRQKLRHDRREALEARRRLEAEQRKIRRLLRRRMSLLRKTSGKQVALRKEHGKLRREARTMQQLLTRLETHLRAGATAPTRTAAATRPKVLRDFRKGVAILPASGTIIRRYGDVGKQGGRIKGIVIRARRNAGVVAPWDGQVQFAGRFRNLGRILIIRHGGAYHSVLLGLNRIDVVAKQWVLAGEPVGVVGEFRGSRTELYYEIRKSARPIDPLPWLAANQRNAR